MTQAAPVTVSANPVGGDFGLTIRSSDWCGHSRMPTERGQREHCRDGRQSRELWWKEDAASRVPVGGASGEPGQKGRSPASAGMGRTCRTLVVTMRPPG